MEKINEQPVSNIPPVTEPADPKIQFLQVMEEKLIYALGPTDKTFIEIVRDPRSIDELIRRQTKIGQKDFVMAVGMIASAVKNNRDYLGKKIFSKYYLESGEAIFDKALGQLRAWEVKPANQSKYSPEAWQERVAAAERAHAWILEFEPKPTSQKDELVEENIGIDQHIAHITNFKVLPPKHDEQGRERKMGERLGILGELYENGKLDEARIQFLLKYADDYGGTLFVSRFGLKSIGDKDVVEIDPQKKSEDTNRFSYHYLIVVFDKKSDSDSIRRFAVADSVLKNAIQKAEESEEAIRVAVGALYAFEEKQGSSISWEDVFSMTKDEAKKIGLKVNHVGDFEGRLEEFLSQEKAEVDNV